MHGYFHDEIILLLIIGGHGASVRENDWSITVTTLCTDRIRPLDICLFTVLQFCGEDSSSHFLSSVYLQKSVSNQKQNKETWQSVVQILLADYNPNS